jgi:hypothetical protein
MLANPATQRSQRQRDEFATTPLRDLCGRGILRRRKQPWHFDLDRRHETERRRKRMRNSRESRNCCREPRHT